MSFFGTRKQEESHDKVENKFEELLNDLGNYVNIAAAEAHGAKLFSLERINLGVFAAREAGKTERTLATFIRQGGAVEDLELLLTREQHKRLVNKLKDGNDIAQ